ncbi:hypothetical protein CUR178_08065 [Leishmania enriettii]|uniref:Uncharacterized protein n=1 Tax=Leishmania enriettii TaxID=5663 RepID=A0A836H5D3_LEIEN|nr:hypothetical protein CUR178_08065 [Leishmania enriettii]
MWAYENCSSPRWSDGDRLRMHRPAHRSTPDFCEPPLVNSAVDGAEEEPALWRIREGPTEV